VPRLNDYDLAACLAALERTEAERPTVAGRYALLKLRLIAARRETVRNLEREAQAAANR
jgi:hypothetical protein